MGVTAIVLAAGRSARLGHPKQLVEIEGRPLLRRTTETALASRCTRVLVIVGYRSEDVAPVLHDLPVEIVENPDWCEGVASSVRAGVGRCLNDKAVLITPCDLPYLTVTHLDEIVERFAAGAILVASQWDDVCGPPALFTPGFYAELQTLKGDAGARRILQKHSGILQTVGFPAGRLDLDTKEELAALNAQKRKANG